MDSPLHENVAMGNEPKVAPGWLQAQAPGPASQRIVHENNLLPFHFTVTNLKLSIARTVFQTLLAFQSFL